MSIRAAPPDRGRPASHRATRQPTGAPRAGRRLAVAICGVLAVTLLAVGTPWVRHYLHGDHPIAAPAPQAAPEHTAEMAAAAPAAPPALAAAFEQFSDGIGAQIGLAYAPVDDPTQVRTLGTWATGPAWSTIKVPLSLALLREDGSDEVTDAMRSAITASDNGAAEEIWEALGAHQTAADKVQSVLADAGQPVPQVKSEVTRPGFSAFGQTEWSLGDQARFLAYAACDVRNTPVLDLMGGVVSSQRWGLGNFDGARIKGGWGPGRDGLYLVRQYGVVTTSHGQLALAIAAVADSGGFGDGTTVLNRMAGWLADHLGSLGGGQCRS